jgi:NitT/TauT family transport system substrate-binding protein
MVSLFSGCKKEETLKVVKLNEVVHSIFYAPQYVAIENNFFEEEGLKIDLSLGNGADKSMTALLSGNADIALMGAEASVYVFNEGKENYAINFAQLTQRAGNFLVAREPFPDFSWDMVKGKTIVGGRLGGMPEMVLEYILKEKGIEPFVDTTIINNLDFSATAGAFSGGMGDFTVEFEPTASTLEQTGDYYVVTSLGVDSGLLPYTTYMVLGSYMDENPETVQKFTNAIYKGQLWVDQHTPEEIAKVIAPYFEGTDLELLTTIVKRYKDQDTWKVEPLLDETAFVLLQDVLDSSGQLEKRVNYDDLVNTTFAKKAVEQVDASKVK